MNRLDALQTTECTIPLLERFVKTFRLAASGKTRFSGLSQTRHSGGDCAGAGGEGCGEAGGPFRRQPRLISCSNGLSVNLIMLLCSDDLQITRSVVTPVPIPVMNTLIRAERPAEHGLGYHPVFILPVHPPIRFAPFLTLVQPAIAEAVPE